MTFFLGSVLSFALEPMFAKMLLSLLGGTAVVLVTGVLYKLFASLGAEITAPGTAPLSQAARLVSACCYRFEPSSRAYRNRRPRFALSVHPDKAGYGWHPLTIQDKQHVITRRGDVPARRPVTVRAPDSSLKLSPTKR